MYDDVMMYELVWWIDGMEKLGVSVCVEMLWCFLIVVLYLSCACAVRDDDECGDYYVFNVKVMFVLMNKDFMSEFNIYV